MKDDDSQEQNVWYNSSLSDDDYLLYEGENITEEDIIKHEMLFHSSFEQQKQIYKNPFCEKCGGNTISLIVSIENKTFTRCISCKHHVVSYLKNT